MNQLLDPVIAYPFFFLFGLALGSFGNVVAYRLPAGVSLGGRSHCPHCNRTLGFLELVPVFSWLFLGAKCRGCKQPIAVQYPLVELAAAILFVLAGVHTSFNLLPALSFGIALWAMLLIVLIDIRTSRIPDVLSFVLGLAGFAYQWFSYGTFTLTGALLGFGFMGLLWVAGWGRWVGSGDIFLAAALGLLVGHWPSMILALMASYIIGAFVAIILLLTRMIGRHAHVPFGPFLIIGALIAFFLDARIFDLVFP